MLSKEAKVTVQTKVHENKGQKTIAKISN